MKKFFNKKGFTLTELMVVVVIMGILVAVAVPIYNNVTTDAQKTAADATARTINSALVQIAAEKGVSQTNLTLTFDSTTSKGTAVTGDVTTATGAPTGTPSVNVAIEDYLSAKYDGTYTFTYDQATGTVSRNPAT